jgi:hypothetical protein
MRLFNLIKIHKYDLHVDLNSGKAYRKNKQTVCKKPAKNVQKTCKKRAESKWEGENAISGMALKILSLT